MSLLVGYQPLVADLSPEHVETMRRNLPTEEYRFLGSWNETLGRSELVGINVRAARIALNTPEETGDDQMIANICETMRNGGPDATRMLGLLSGYPKEDVEAYTEQGASFFDLADIDEYQKGKGAGTDYLVLGGVDRLMSPMMKLFGLIYNRDRKKDTVMGYGLIWGSTEPPSEAAERQCQKLMEMDRMLGLTKWARKINPLCM